jgi:hypothetical protein
MALWMGVGEATISRAERAGTYAFRHVKMVAAARLLGIAFEELRDLLSGDDAIDEKFLASRPWFVAAKDAIFKFNDTVFEIPPGTARIALRRIPYFDLAMCAGGWSESSDARTADDADGFIEVPSDAPRDSFAFRIRGNCMEPKFPDGAIVICVLVHPGDNGEKFVPGKAYYFQHVENKCTFKLVYWEPQHDRWRLEPINKKHKPIFVPAQQMARMSRAVRIVIDV